MSQKILILFAGKPEMLGGLTNEKELAKKCPKEFQQDNPWSNYAMKLFYNGGNIKNWKWKSDDDGIKEKQFACFYGLLGTFGLRHEDKKAIAGWMLSEMLQEVPEHIAK
jgi:hypothetical protein